MCHPRKKIDHLMINQIKIDDSSMTTQGKIRVHLHNWVHFLALSCSYRN